jgi:hypothetical protein
MAARSNALIKIVLLISISLTFLHYTSAPSISTPTSTYAYDDALIPSWRESLGLDHYQDLEDKVRGKISDGAGKFKSSLQSLSGGLGWGKKGARLGSLYSVSYMLLN